jgi:plasmid maintenance system antidote protein VapI
MQFIAGKRSITDDTAFRLGHWFKTDPQFELSAALKESGKIIQKLPMWPAEQGGPLIL